MTSGAWAHLSPSVALALSAVPSSRPAALVVFGGPQLFDIWRVNMGPQLEDVFFLLKT